MKGKWWSTKVAAMATLNQRLTPEVENLGIIASEAKQSRSYSWDCFVATLLAMTGKHSKANLVSNRCFWVAIGLLCWVGLLALAGCAAAAPTATPTAETTAVATPTAEIKVTPIAEATPTAEAPGKVEPTVTAGGGIAGISREHTPTLAPLDIVAGKKVFDQFCGSCHPDGKESEKGPNIIVTKLTDDQINNLVRYGGVTMPYFKLGFLSEQDLANIIAYIRSLK